MFVNEESGVESHSPLCHQIQIKFRLHSIDKGRDPQHADTAREHTADQGDRDEADLNIEIAPFVPPHEKPAVSEQLFYAAGRKI